MSWFTRLLSKSSAQPARGRLDPAAVTQLFEAIDADDLSQLEAVLKRGVDPNSRLLDWPALIYALVRNRMVLADYLVMYGADPNSSGGPDTALTLAIEKGSARVVESLIEAGADVNLRGGFGNLTPKEHAIRQSNSEIIRSIEQALGTEQSSPAAQLRTAAGVGDVAGVKQLIATQGPFDATELGAALQWAARNHHGPDTVEIVRELVAAGADIDFHDESDPHAPIRSAAEKKNIELLRFLIEQRADPTVGHAEGHSAMYLCRLDFDESGKEVADLLKSARPRKLDNATLVAAAGAGAYEIVRQALDAGVDANAVSACGEEASPALVAAAGAHDPPTLQLLLARGADPNRTGSPLGNTPLRAAILASDEDAVRTLIDAGADLEHRNSQGEDAVDLAYWCGARDIAQILIQAKMRQ